jgi:hypothetical protein
VSLLGVKPGEGCLSRREQGLLCHCQLSVQCCLNAPTPAARTNLPCCEHHQYWCARPGHAPLGVVDALPTMPPATAAVEPPHSLGASGTAMMSPRWGRGLPAALALSADLGAGGRAPVAPAPPLLPPAPAPPRRGVRLCCCVRHCSRGARPPLLPLAAAAAAAAKSPAPPPGLSASGTTSRRAASHTYGFTGLSSKLFELSTFFGHVLCGVWGRVDVWVPAEEQGGDRGAAAGPSLQPGSVLPHLQKLEGV